MAQYSTKRKYTKKSTAQLKKVVKKVKKETVEAVEAVANVSPATVSVVKSYWQRAVDWVKGLVY
jgi:hypothetical protein